MVSFTPKLPCQGGMPCLEVERRNEPHRANVMAMARPGINAPALLEARGIDVLTYSQVPRNDGAISLGQAVAAAANRSKQQLWPTDVHLATSMGHRC
jgi:hypothetical protein